MEILTSDIIALASIGSTILITAINCFSNAYFSCSKDRLERKCRAYDDFYVALSIFSHPDDSDKRDFETLTLAYYRISMFASPEIKDKIKSLLDAYLTLSEYCNEIRVLCALNNNMHQYYRILNSDASYISQTSKISLLVNEVLDAIHNEVETLSK